MAVSYLTGNEKPTAAKMNELWAEADSIIDKALNGGSTYLLENIGASASASSYPDSFLYRGTEFAWLTGGTHTAASTSVLYSAFDTLPTHHSQSSYDTAADAATVASYSSDGYAHLAGSSTPNLINSLKIHTRTDSGTEYEIWEYTQPAPEKENKYAVAEYIIGMGSGTSIILPPTYNKYNCFKLHNLTDRTYTIYLDESASPTDTFTIPPYSQRCVRRISAGVFDYSYKYFFKVERNDPRFITFDSFDGSIAQTMRANNITNPSFIYNLFEFVGIDNTPEFQSYGATPHERYHQRIYFNPTTKNDIGSEYETAGHFPAITDSTKVGDLVYHKGKIGYRKKDISSSTLEVGEIDFDGWDSFNTNLAAIDAALAVSGITNNDDTKIATSATPYELIVWPVSTNVLQINDVNQALNLASTTYNLQTHFLKPPDHGLTPRLYNRYFSELVNQATSTLGAPINVSKRYNGKTYTVGNLKSYLTSYQSNSTPENKSVALTSEGPYLLWRDVFPIKGTVSGDSEGWFSGLTTNHAFSLELVGGVPKLKIDQEWFIPLRLYSASYGGGSPKGQANYLYAYTCGWPSHWKDAFFNAVVADARHHIDTHKFHRMFEGPRKTRLYETATPITAGTETFKHNDIADDPLGTDGADFTQNNIGALTDTDIAIQTNDIDLKISKGSFSGGEVNNPNYPRTVIDDKIKEAQDSKSASSLNEVKTLSDYNRLNLLKEHFNNFAVMLKKADKIRPLSVDEIYFGNRKMNPGSGWFNDTVAPVNLYEGFVDGDAQFDFYTDLLGSSKILDYTDFADGTSIRAAANTTGSPTERDDLDDFRWVKISDVQDFATAEGLGFRFEEVAVPVTWTSSLTQTVYNGTDLSVTNGFLAAIISSTSNSYKAGWGMLSGMGVNGMVVGEHYGTGFDYTQLTDSVSETLGTSYYNQAGMNYVFSAVNLLPIFKDNLGTSANYHGYPTGLVIQIVDSQRTNNPRAKLAVEPLKTVRLDNAGTSMNNGVDVAPTASSQLVDITTDKHLFFPSDSRHRYAYLLNVTAPTTHSA
tara:strand:+ start:2030 stop:5158 length:3129 start_codon:yes stop_codon:yes gene_type:complete